MKNTIIKGIKDTSTVKTTNLSTEDIEKIFGAKAVGRTDGMNPLDVLEMMKQKLEKK